MNEEDVKNAFFREALIDMGYVDLGPWEVDAISAEERTITFKLEESYEERA